MGHQVSRNNAPEETRSSGEPQPPVRFQLMSDLHLETSQYNFDFPVAAENLALLGDIGNTVDAALFEWLDAQLRRFMRVFFVAGNHEAYRSTLPESRKRLQKYAAQNERFVLLDRTRYDLSPSLTILGCTLWSKLDAKQASHIFMSLNDFRQIRDFDLRTYEGEHVADLEWLVRHIGYARKEHPQRKIIVFTHNTPTYNGTSNPKYEGSLSGSAFSTELANKRWWRPPIVLWGFGHTHYSCDLNIGGVRLVSNQKGYFRDPAAGFVEDTVVQLN
ncbi:hypothetical protein CALCODRAFT_519956 [Calocera cornea HHB12733]|uniref:Calcineurin-like phosphoesterase domain-containing protein n=1 Tax=Calocera cornea HHB12733 TaxID=1353952 RepID=A0A165DV86_9BASI|nr:hypothetical protein CALCODRAFT_519956 [Calocera cornea HHB12733]